MTERTHAEDLTAREAAALHALVAQPQTARGLPAEDDAGTWVALRSMELREPRFVISYRP